MRSELEDHAAMMGDLRANIADAYGDLADALEAASPARLAVRDSLNEYIDYIDGLDEGDVDEIYDEMGWEDPDPDDEDGDA